MDTQSFAELHPSVSSPASDRPFSLPGGPYSVARATSPVRKTAQCCRKKGEDIRGQGDTGRQATTISALPANVLLEIFCFYKEESGRTYRVWKWHLLAHLCRGWRQVIFASPLHLDLQIFCTSITPARKNLGIWPALPIHVYYSRQEHGKTASNEDNIVAALEHADRVCNVTLDVTDLELEKISTVMREPFPVLTTLRIFSSEHHGIAPALPVEFLGGSAPRLQSIYLYAIPFPALPTLLLSTSDLVYLHLRNIPQTGYISPEAMVVGLAALPNLHTFRIKFQLATPRPDRMLLPPVSRAVLPALTEFNFKGASEYLEDLVARIDAPQLDWFFVSYLNQFADFQVPQLSMFIDRSVGTKVTAFRYARVTFYNHLVIFRTDRHANASFPDPHYATTGIKCQGIDWQVSHIAQVISHFSETLSNVAHLRLEVEDSIQSEGTDNVEWLLLLQQFPSVQTLHVSHQLAGHIALALEAIAWETDDKSLPSLALIYLVGRSASSIAKFIAARQLSGRPVTVINTEGVFTERVKLHVSE